MPRIETARLAWQVGKEMDAYLRQRAWHWTVRKNHALAADYVIRLLNRHPRDPLGLLLGEIVGKHTDQPVFVEKCAAAKGRLCALKGVDDVAALLPSTARPTPDELKAFLKDAQAEEEAAAIAIHKRREEVTKGVGETRIKGGKEEGRARVEWLSVGETAAVAETQAMVQRCCCRMQAEALAVLAEPKDAVHGRGLFAARRIPPRTAILADDPFFALRFDEGCCAHCLRPLPRGPGELSGAVNCPHCQGSGEAYCGKACQEAAWSQSHACCCASVNPTFSRWQQATQAALYGCAATEALDSRSDARGALSRLAVAKLCAMATMQQLHPLELPGLRSLRGVVDYEPSTALSEIGALAVTLSSIFHQPNLFMEEVLSLLALLQTNEFFLTGSGGVALYTTLSLLNHSCDPNCVVIKGDSPLQRRLISLRDIRDGEQLFIDYNSHLTSKLDYEHRKALCAQRHFECFCSKCIRRI